MAKNEGQYIIDQKLINDIICKHPNKERIYNKYCITCKKNICFWCKGHKNHKTTHMNQLNQIKKNMRKLKMQ